MNEESELFFRVAKIIHTFKEPGVSWDEGTEGLKRQSLREAVPITMAFIKHIETLGYCHDQH